MLSRIVRIDKAWYTEPLITFKQFVELTDMNKPVNEQL